MDIKGKEWIEAELLKGSREGKKPSLTALPEGEVFSPSLQNELMDKSGLWPYLRIWDARQLQIAMEERNGI
jgi:hypothetical protein